ncbi:SulP family inorganic anion transporter [Planobispora siamensis]|uniref:carbonic anhydrase n=1 Tax=Planobispora siamensis TaxID=936338 RepID=A0A8J3WIP6_9ACTN|nr:SulP family inorganic anion transporter [Planobispora siamensis]GIH90665.1 carbonic anhydrase [Planobispora siamensis]
MLRHDLPASLVVFLVAVPLSLGIAAASGAPLMAGLIAGVVGGVVAGAMGGSVVQVSGPAAGLALVVADLVSRYGWPATCMITLLAGGLQMMLGVLRVARTALAVSPAVVHGMLAGVGVVIALSQAHVVLGGSPHASALENIVGLPGQVAREHGEAVLAGLLTLAVLIAWPRLPQRVRSVPAPLAALLSAAAAAALLGWEVTRIDLPASLSQWSAPVWPQGDWHGIAGAVVLVALLAGVESLLCSVATDKLHDGERTDLDRELTAQGAANIVTGALGGLPVAGVIVRSTTNVRAGARSRWSTVLHGVWILLFAVGLGWTVAFVPMEALAALLVFIGFQMVNVGHVRNLHGHREVPVYVATLAGVVLLGLAEGVLLGLGLAALLALRRLTGVTVRARPEPCGRRWHVLIDGSLTFLGVPRLTAELRAVPAGTEVDLELNIDFMDNAAFEAVHAWRQEHERGGGTVHIDELHDEWYTMAASGARLFPAKTPPRIPDRWWLPWSHRRRRGRAAGVPAPVRHPAQTAPDDLMAGATEFHRRTAPLIRPVLHGMARVQQPSHLFITCADSRVVPNLITASGPGDLFTVRNIGNLVPRRGMTPADDSVTAAIEYATGVLGVRTVTVCGHSGCGAMAALLGGKGTGELPGLDRWLRHGGPSLARFVADGVSGTGHAEGGTGEGHGDGGGDGLGGGGPLDRLCRLNVIQQLDNLRTHPRVDRLVRAGELELVGLYFDIGTARVHMLDRTAAPDAAPTATI